MSLQRKIRLTREGWFYVVVLCFILGGAILREVNLLFVLAGMLAGPLVLSLRSVSTMLGGVQNRADHAAGRLRRRFLDG